MHLSPLGVAGRRQPVFARRGAVATSQPLAAQVGLSVLQAGGNAVDAAIATAAALTVVEPCSNGLGSDAFALVWHDGRPHGLNGSGRSTRRRTARDLVDAGRTAMPQHGWDAVTVPGAVRAWADLHARFGRLDFAALLEPAAVLAEEGFAVSGVVAAAWERAVALAEARRGAHHDPAEDAFLPHFAPLGRAPAIGEVWRSATTAATLRALGASRGEDLYTGAAADRLVAFAAATGGFLDADDLAAHRSEWVDPIGVSYRDHEVWEIPPNGQGIAALIALRILDGHDPADVAPFGAPGVAAADAPPRPASWHRAIEAVKAALVDTHAFVADPAHADVPTAALLADAHIGRRRAALGERAHRPVAVDPRSSDTVYLCTADDEGNQVSFIQSNFAGFGAGIVVPGTGISLQNRGWGFSLEPGHPNELAPGKRPFHTIIPGFLTRGGEPVGPFGVMGGHMQAQGHVQVVLDAVEHGDDPQTALGRPRWFWDAETGRVDVESTAGTPVVAALAARGHDALATDRATTFGRGQAIWRLENGTLVAGSEPRADAYPLGW
ncbi:gamma-glutamyltransferase family protein [Propioniciclava coleopterorum]|uniref:gamma-glutamyltransferase family protein n=1 Tax=Propioniciclava coleopterorum TaxID=2714937 RepID=UPI001980F69C|nr:gamma-glutamyltransferase family protein [Propioniciclava coleopterorum]